GAPDQLANRGRLLAQGAMRKQYETSKQSKQKNCRKASYSYDHWGSNLISINSLVSWGAGSNFQCPTAVTALCVSNGWPPFTSMDFTDPLGATVASIFTTPWIFMECARVG